MGGAAKGVLECSTVGRRCGGTSLCRHYRAVRRLRSQGDQSFTGVNWSEQRALEGRQAEVQLPLRMLSCLGQGDGEGKEKSRSCVCGCAERGLLKGVELEKLGE